MTARSADVPATFNAAEDFAELSRAGSGSARGGGGCPWGDACGPGAGAGFRRVASIGFPASAGFRAMRLRGRAPPPAVELRPLAGAAASIPRRAGAEHGARAGDTRPGTQYRLWPVERLQVGQT